MEQALSIEIGETAKRLNRSVQLISIRRKDPHTHLCGCFGRVPVPPDKFTGIGKLPKKAAEFPEGDDEVHGNLRLYARHRYYGMGRKILNIHWRVLLWPGVGAMAECPDTPAKIVLP
ncbi:MAG: hypothetical protein WC100_00175 [Sterolibacterium sp.]